MTQRICVVTGSRADYGLLFWLMKEIDADPAFELKIVATGMHLSPDFGLTYRVIENDGFRIDHKVEMLLSGDTASSTAKSIGLGVIGFSDAIVRLRPDMMVLLGDRFEVFAAAQAALVARIPIAHLCGGDTTEGAFDEAMRHGITKMSHLHFVTNGEAELRVRQLGEDPEHVFNVGSPGIDFLKRMEYLDRSELENRLDFRFRNHNLLVTFHPATLEVASPSEQFRIVLDALDRLPANDFGLIFTKPNADNHGRELMAMIDEYVARRANARAYTSLGPQLYLSVLAQVDAVVGNSSSALYEAPSLGTPSVDIGDRQKGRILADSVVHCEVSANAIVEAIQSALSKDCRNTVNPYGSGESVPRIIAVLKCFPDPSSLVQKRFFDQRPGNERN